MAQADLEHQSKARIGPELGRPRLARGQQQAAMHHAGIARLGGNEYLRAASTGQQYPQGLALVVVQGGLRFKDQPDRAMCMAAGVAQHAMHDALGAALGPGHCLPRNWTFVVLCVLRRAAGGPRLSAMGRALRAMGLGARRGYAFAVLGLGVARLVWPGCGGRVAVGVGRLEHRGLSL